MIGNRRGRIRVWALVIACAGIGAGTGVYFYLTRASGRSWTAVMIERDQLQQEGLRAMLTAGGYADLTRPRLPVVAVTPVDALRAERVPDGERGPVLGYPSFDEVNRYCLSRGVFEGTTDEDAMWLLRVIEEHPDGGARICAVRALPTLLSEGLPMEFARSSVNEGFRRVVHDKLLELMRKDSEVGRIPDLQYTAVLACSTARLWRLDEVRDAIESYYAARLDNHDVSFCHIRDNALSEMKRTPRGKHIGSSE